MTPLTLPQARIPLGWAMVNGQRVAVEIDIEWMRALTTIVQRTGGTNGDGSFADYLPSLFGLPQSSTETQEALRAVDELRNELASTRGYLKDAFDRIESLEAGAAALRPEFELRSRIEQIEGRLN